MVLSITTAPGPSPTKVAAKVQDKADQLADKNADSTESEVRYMAYFARLRTALRATHRYIAYTSDIGEAFRPIIRPWIVTTAYGVSWAYLVGDVGFETWKASRRGPSPLEAATFTESQRLALVATKRGAFQAIASMALPALTIHTLVAQSAKLWKHAFASNPRARAWAPTITGLSAVPILPYLYDAPVEAATDKVFEWAEEKWYERKAKEKIRRKNGDL